MNESIGKRFVSEKVLLEEYVRRDVSIFGVFQYLSKADVFFVKDENDVRPYKYFKRYYLLAVFMKMPYWIRDCVKK